MKTSTCSCGRAATATVTIPVRIMAEHRTELQKCRFCPACAAAFAQPEPSHSERMAEEERATIANAAARVDANTQQLVAAIDAWLHVDREDVRAVSNAASELCRISRNLSAYAGDIAQVVSRREWRHA